MRHIHRLFTEQELVGLRTPEAVTHEIQAFIKKNRLVDVIVWNEPIDRSVYVSGYRKPLVRRGRVMKPSACPHVSWWRSRKDGDGRRFVLLELEREDC